MYEYIVDRREERRREWKESGRERKKGNKILTTRQEITSVEIPKYAYPIDEDEDDDPEYTPDGEVGLEVGVVDEFGAVEPLGFHASVCRVG